MVKLTLILLHYTLNSYVFVSILVENLIPFNLRRIMFKSDEVYIFFQANIKFVKFYNSTCTHLKVFHREHISLTLIPSEKLVICEEVHKIYINYVVVISQPEIKNRIF